MKHFLLSFLALLATSSLFSQEDLSRVPEYKIKYMIGTTFSTTYGSGLSYSIVNKNHGFNVSILPYISTGNVNSNLSNIGFSYNYYFRKNNVVDFSLKLGANRKNGQFFISSIDIINPNYDNAKINIGIGPELNFHLAKEFDITVNLGYGVYDIMNNLNSSLSAGIGVYYNVYK